MVEGFLRLDRTAVQFRRSIDEIAATLPERLGDELRAMAEDLIEASNAFYVADEARQAFQEGLDPAKFIEARKRIAELRNEISIKELPQAERPAAEAAAG